MTQETKTEAAVPAPAPRSDAPLDAKGLEELSAKIGRKVTLETCPLTPAAHEWVTAEQQKLWAQRRGHDARRLWDMLKARARNQERQLTLAEAQETEKARLALRDEYIGLEPDSTASTEAEPCFNCGSEFPPMLVNVRRDGYILRTREGQPIKSGNYAVLRIDEKGDADETGMPTPVGICKKCKPKVGGEFYSLARAKELAEKAKREDNLAAKADKVRAAMVQRPRRGDGVSRVARHWNRGEIR